MKPYRIERLASTVRMVVSDAIANRLSDPRISPFASVTRVELSRDLEVADVYVSVMGSKSEQRKTIAGLDRATGHVQRFLARQLKARQCPTLRFHLDESLKKGMETIRAIDEAMAELEQRDSHPDLSAGAACETEPAPRDPDAGAGA